MAQVQKNSGTTSLSASIVPTLGVATTAGNTILIFANGAGTITTPSGFTSRSPQVNIQGLYLFEKLVASGTSADTPTLTMSGAYNATWQIAEYSGLTAFDVSSGNNSGQVAGGSKPTPSITPTTGARTLVAFMGVTGSSASITTFASGDPQSWTNSFTGQDSSARLGGGGAGNDSMVGGWAQQLGVTGNGVTTFSTAATFTPTGGTGAPATIIASYTEAAAGATYTLTAAAGSFSLAGQAATLREARKLVAAPGAFLLNGQAIVLRDTLNLVAAPGAVALTGIAANLAYASSGSRVLTAAAGSFALTGKAATLRDAHNLVAVKGAFALTGVAANLSVVTHVNYVLPCGSGAFVLSRFSAVLRRNVGIFVPAFTRTVTAASERRSVIVTS